MEEFLGALGTFSAVIMALIGLLAGWIAATVSGGNKALYMILGVVGAFVLPFILAALGAGALFAAGVAGIIVAALIGAVILLVVGRLLFRRA